MHLKQIAALREGVHEHEYVCAEGGGEGGSGAGAGAGSAVGGARRNERRRSSCVRRDPDDILRSLRAVKGELGRTLSLSGSTARRKYRWCT